MPLDSQRFHDDGYLVVKGFFGRDEGLLAAIRHQIEAVAAHVCPGFDPWGPNNFLPLSDHQRSSLYRSLRYLPSLTAMASAESMLAVMRELGLQFPAVMQSYNIRMDIPQNETFLFHWHQDLTYLLGSLNAVTAWIPLTKADVHHGTIEIIPKSHTQGVFPINYTSEKPLTPSTSLSPKDLHLAEEPKEPGLFIEVEPGDLVLFSQLLMHRSTYNASDAIRWTIQLRYADLMHPGFLEAGYPFGDATNIYHTPYMKQPAPMG